MALLFQPWKLKGLEIKNRIMMSPMCQYSVWAEDGAPNDWHFVHYISRAVGGVGLVMMEMTDVVPDGRITVNDLGIWSDRQIDAFRRIIDQVHQYDAKVGIQLAHAGRKAESESLRPEAPSAIRFSPRYRVPHALTGDEIKGLIDAFAAGARRACEAGVDTLELHGAHGYLLQQFMSPLSNQRDDEWGEYTKFPTEVIRAVRSAIPGSMPLAMRVSAVEYDPKGYTFEQLVEMAKVFHQAGVDLFDVSSGGNAPIVPDPIYPGYHVPYGATIRREVGVPVIAVGILEDPHLAESVLQQGQADIIALARGLLRDPYWPNTAAMALDGTVQVPKQYYRAFKKSFLGLRQD
ncbi:MAG: NADH:flavin oxidoreductase/NADH oxidase [Firmicutes bacterium]|nr:NADH:flavin oxidoreductase/NADH oxidase [Bacillota bacterium]